MEVVMDTKSESFELIGLGPAATGWRAVYSGGGAGEVPLLYWGVFRRTRRDAGGVPEDLGTVMEGIVVDQQPGAPVRSFACAADTEGFEGYLPPA
jgi:hypothetical protein